MIKSGSALPPVRIFCMTAPFLDEESDVLVAVE